MLRQLRKLVDLRQHGGQHAHPPVDPEQLLAVARALFCLSELTQALAQRLGTLNSARRSARRKSPTPRALDAGKSVLPALHWPARAFAGQARAPRASWQCRPYILPVFVLKPALRFIPADPARQRADLFPAAHTFFSRRHRAAAMPAIIIPERVPFVNMLRQDNGAAEPPHPTHCAQISQNM